MSDSNQPTTRASEQLVEVNVPEFNPRDSELDNYLSTMFGGKTCTVNAGGHPIQINCINFNGQINKWYSNRQPNDEP